MGDSVTMATPLPPPSLCPMATEARLDEAEG